MRRSALLAPVRTIALPNLRRRSRWGLHDARRISMCVLAMGSTLCAGALLTGPVVAAPVSESNQNGPQVAIIRPGYNDVLKGKYRILIAVTAKKYNPQSVEMFVDGVSATGGPVPLSSLASSSFDWDTRGFSDGKHKLTVRVTDAQGFRGWSEVTVFVNNGRVVDTVPPDLRWIGIEPFQQLSGQVQLEVDAADNFGVKLLQIQINPIETPNRTPALYSWLLNQPPYRVNLDTLGRKMPDGLYSLKALAFDSNDQQGDAPPLTVGIVNNEISTTTVGEMLRDRREMADLLANGNGTAAPNPPVATPTATPAAPTPAATPATPATPPKQSPAVPVESNQVASGTPLLPSQPPTDPRALPPAPPANVPNTPPANVRQPAAAHRRARRCVAPADREARDRTATDRRPNRRAHAANRRSRGSTNERSARLRSVDPAGARRVRARRNGRRNARCRNSRWRDARWRNARCRDARCRDARRRNARHRRECA